MDFGRDGFRARCNCHCFVTHLQHLPEPSPSNFDPCRIKHSDRDRGRGRGRAFDARITVSTADILISQLQTPCNGRGGHKELGRGMISVKRDGGWTIWHSPKDKSYPLSDLHWWNLRKERTWSRRILGRMYSSHVHEASREGLTRMVHDGGIHDGIL